MFDTIIELNQNQALLLPYYKSILPKSINNEINLSKKILNTVHHYIDNVLNVLKPIAN